MKVKVAGHTYELSNFENKDAEGQTLQFIHKEPEQEYKQETIEEAAKKHYSYEYCEDTSITDNRRDAFIQGARWQAERMYSEEEVKKIIELHSDFIYDRIDDEGISNSTSPIYYPTWNDDKFFEQTKKK